MFGNIQTQRLRCVLVLTGIFFVAGGAVSRLAIAQPPPMRRHTTTKARTLRLMPANRTTRFEPRLTIREDGEFRVIEVNGIPEHKVGMFPNRGNPHSIAESSGVYRVPLSPEHERRPQPLEMHVNFGVAVNGVMFDPGAAEFWQGNPRSGWQYEALGGAVALGLDANYAHVQPDGNYHYHGLPTGLLKRLDASPGQHSPLIGWAADGFPIYAQHGFSDPDDAESSVKELLSSYRVRRGTRPGGRRGTLEAPGGTYDGAFVNDYEFVEEIGDLDECNGRFCVTPEFPDGTYAYFLTSDFPVVPRQFRGTPDRSFQKRMRPPGPDSSGFGPPGGGPAGNGPPPGPPPGGFGRPPGPPPPRR